MEKIREEICSLFCFLFCSSTTTQQKAVMTYEIVGSNVSLTLSPEEMDEIIDALETVNSESKLLEAWWDFRKEEFAWTNEERLNLMIETMRDMQVLYKLIEQNEKDIPPPSPPPPLSPYPGIKGKM
jgi:hypothetical protein